MAEVLTLVHLGEPTVREGLIGCAHSGDLGSRRRIGIRVSHWLSQARALIH
jgi:hypothetical protein